MAEPRLLLGPVLRWLGPHRATIWLQTDRPCTVEVAAGSAGGEAGTFTAYGHHYALVVVQGLAPGTETPYQVLLDGTPVWPVQDSRFPPSVIRTPSPDGSVRLLFGSCREATSRTTAHSYPPDALDAYARHLIRGEVPWPSYLMLLGDQVYADKITPRTDRSLKGRRRRRGDHSGGLDDAPAGHVADFTEYTHVYTESWSDPEVRWLLSTVPSMMIFDDHEVVDDWNTSEAWRRRINSRPWWRDRIIGGLASYWVYQHLGNLSPDELATDPTWKAARNATDAGPLLDEFAAAADAEADGRPGPRWSYRIDLGRTRVVVLDTRCSRVLAESRRDMLPASEWQWFVDQLAGDYDHLVVGSSLPWLLPPAIHEAEGWNEKLCQSRVPLVATVSEWLRQAVDLEHWAAFRGSFDRLGDVLSAVAEGHFTNQPPASVSVLSGDVHHTYLARIDREGRPGADIFQVTCSPMHNQAPHALKLGFLVGWSRTAARLGGGLARLSGRTPSPYRWRRLTGPYFQNALGILLHEGRSARLSFHGTGERSDGPVRLTTLYQNPLTSGPR